MAERGKLLHPENLDFEVGQEVEWGQKGQMGENWGVNWGQIELKRQMGEISKGQ